MKANYPLSKLIILAISLLAPFANSAEPPWPDALKEAQIKVLITGDPTRLRPFSEGPGAVRVAADWTILAAKQLASAKADVSRESALLTSELLFKGANRFVREGSPPERRSIAVQNLQKFIGAEIELGRKENPEKPKIGETTFTHVSF